MAALRSAVLVAALAGASSQSQQYAQCLEKYQCIFHHDYAGKEWSWDLHNLCKATGDGYFFNTNNGSEMGGQSFYFNICGSTPRACLPQTWNMYYTRGAATQFWGKQPLNNPQAPCMTGPACPDEFSAVNNSCCTGDCAVLASSYAYFELIDKTNPSSGGISFSYSAQPPDNLEITARGVVWPKTPNGLYLERTLNIYIACDPSGAMDRADLMTGSAPWDGPAYYVESPQCTYNIYMKSKAACGVTGDPYSNPTTLYGAGAAFGFCVLGAALCLVVQVVHWFGEGRGWWDPIKQRLPWGKGGYKSSYASASTTSYADTAKPMAGGGSYGAA